MDAVWGNVVVGVQQAENSQAVKGIKGFLKVDKYNCKQLVQLLCMVNAIVRRKLSGPPAGVEARSQPGSLPKGSWPQCSW